MSSTWLPELLHAADFFVHLTTLKNFKIQKLISSDSNGFLKTSQVVIMSPSVAPLENIPNVLPLSMRSLITERCIP